jgi:hypothetical protein
VDLLCSILAEMSKMSRELHKPHRLSLTITSRETGSIFLQHVRISALNFCKIHALRLNQCYCLKYWQYIKSYEILLVFHGCCYGGLRVNGHDHTK